MPDDHSPLAPRLPIPNRTVKRWRADDSTDSPCESRSSSGTLQAKRPTSRGPFCLNTFLGQGVQASTSVRKEYLPPAVAWIFTRILVVVVEMKETVRLTSLLPVTEPWVTQAAPFHA